MLDKIKNTTLQLASESKKSIKYYLNTKKYNMHYDIVNKIEEYGIAVIPGFLSIEDCKTIRFQIDDFIKKFPDLINTDEADSDYRLFGAENVSEMIEDFHNNKFIKEISQSYTKTDVENLFTMANRVKFKEGNKGSGGGWHRDSFAKQIKAIIYLNDVDTANGPFQYLNKTMRSSDILKDTWLSDLEHKQTRLAEEDVKKILETRKIELTEVRGKAGTLVIADTSGIHRGKPLDGGLRYALTNYIYSSVDINESLKNHFKSSVKFIE